MNGADHSEEDLRAAEEWARSAIEGRMRTKQEGKASLLGDEDGTVLTLAQLQVLPLLKEELEVKKYLQWPEDEEIKADCTDPASHRWSKPEGNGPGVPGLRSHCTRCRAEISTSIQGDAVEVMEDLLQQIPKLKRASA